MKTTILTKTFTLKLVLILFFGISNLSAQNFWTPTSYMNPASAYVPAISAAQGTTILASNWAYGVWRTVDNGANWFPTSLPGKIFFLSQGPNGTNFAISTDNTGPKIYRSIDNGLSWIEVHHAAHTNNFFFGGGIAFMDANTAVAAVSFTLGPTIGDIGVDIVRSTDGGATWNHIGIMNGWGAANAIKKLNDGRILVATSLAGLWQSTNNGTNWTRVTSFPQVFANSIVTNSQGYIFVGRSTAEGYTSLIFRSVNGGASWDQFLSEAVIGNGNGGEVMDMYIDNNDNIFASLVKFDPPQKKLYTSKNNGMDWTEVISGIPSDATVYSLTGNSQNILFAGTNTYGVYKGNDNVSSIGNENQHPEIFTLQQNFPNPFNPETTIKYSLASQGKVTLNVFDITGKIVKTLVNAFQPQGDYSITFNATDLTSGIYFYKMEITSDVNSYSEIKKMMLVK